MSQPIDFTKLDGMTGKITATDITDAEPGNHERCALAVALWRIFPECQAYVDDYVKVWNKATDTYLNMFMGDDLLIWVDFFDNQMGVDPVKLEIRPYTPFTEACDIKWIIDIKQETANSASKE